MQKTSKFALLSVMLCFFAMGFVDLVGIASNYVKEDLGLNDKTANIFPSLVFFWFLIFSVPTGMLMNKIGRKKTVLLSLIVTVVSLFIPLLGESFGVMLVAFSLLGIGNALMQTSLNPLVSTVLKGGNLASTLTFGQFVKAIASFMAPYIAMWGAVATIPSFGLGWRVLFPIYMVVGIISSLLLAVTAIEEEKTEGKASSFADCFKLLGKPIVLLNFSGRATVMDWEVENIPTILNVWFGGSEAADAICDVVFGDVAPSGKLTVTMPRNVGQIPIYYNHLNTGRPNPRWFTKYTSNYLDVPNDPLFPFGYGLSYTTFKFGKPSFKNGKLTVSLSNTGQREGTEVVQVYVRNPRDTNGPKKTLRAFQRVTLKPGETRKVEILLPRESFELWDAESNTMRVLPGKHEIMVGNSSENLQKIQVYI